MGRPPSNGGPAFRFTAPEVTEMETILQEHNNAMPAREVLVNLAEKFSDTPDRQGKIVVQMKQVWNWFQNKRYAIRAKSAKAPAKLSVSTLPPAPSLPPMLPMPHPPPISRDDFTQQQMNVAQAVSAASGRIATDNSAMEFEAKSARDGAWYDVANFLSVKNLEAGDPEVLVRFAGFGPEEDEWLNVKKLVRQRSLPCESSECVAVLPGDLILCFQEGKEQALYYDAHVLDAQRRRHDVRGCRCRFLVRYDHDQSEEIVPLRKICRRPETDYRLQQLHAVNESAPADQQKPRVESSTVSATRATGSPAELVPKPQKAEENANSVAMVTPANANVPAATNSTQALNAPPNTNFPAVSNTIQVPITPIAYAPPATNASQAPLVPAEANVPAATETTTQEPKSSETTGPSNTESSGLQPGGAAPMSGIVTSTVTSGFSETMLEGK